MASLTLSSTLAGGTLQACHPRDKHPESPREESAAGSSWSMGQGLQGERRGSPSQQEACKSREEQLLTLVLTPFVTVPEILF